MSGAAATLTAPTSPLSTFVSPKSEEPEAFLARYALGAPLGQVSRDCGPSGWPWSAGALACRLATSPDVHAITVLSIIAHAQGTYGTVHSAVNRATGEEVAVKVLPKQHAASRNQRSALHREVGSWAVAQS